METLLEQLAEVYECCAQRRQYYETVCQRIRILLKPWPKPRASPTAEKAAVNQEKQAENIPPEIEDAECKELVMLDKAVVKAQRMRNRLQQNMQNLQITDSEYTQSKDKSAPTKVIQVNTKKQHSTNDKKQKSAQSPKQSEEKRSPHSAGANNHNCRVFASEKAKCKNPMNSTTAEVNKTHSKANPNHGSATIEVNKTRSKANPNHGTISEKKLNSLLQSRTKQQSHIAAQQRPTSRTSSHGVKYKPAHMTAPFKTQPTVRSKRPVSRVGTARTKQSTVISKQVVLNSTTVKKTALVTNSDKNVNAICSAVDRKSYVERWSSELPDKFGADPVGNGIWDAAAEQREMREDDGKETIVQETPSDVENEEEGFCLLRNGREIPVPKPLRQAAAVNARLQKKVKLAAITTKVREKSNMADCFLRHLQQHILHDIPDGLSMQRVCELRCTYDRLYAMLTDLHVEKLDDCSSWQRILRCRKTLQFIFTTFADLYDEYQQLTRDLPQCTPIEEPEVNCTEKSSQIIWLPSTLSSAMAPVCTVSNYQRLQQLHRNTTLLHQLQLLKLQAVILDQMKTEMLPLLEGLDPRDPQFRPIFRSTYAMLCCQGQSFPSLVHDSDEDEPDQSSV